MGYNSATMTYKLSLLERRPTSAGKMQTQFRRNYLHFDLWHPLWCRRLEQYSAFHRAQGGLVSQVSDITQRYSVARHFNRVFSLLEPENFREMFTCWVQEMLLETPLSGVIAIDGKTVRGSRKKGAAGIHRVNAWATEKGISLGQLKVDAKSNEITAVPELLETLAITGCLVTADAMSCQKRIATKIQKKGADYLLAVKKNQRKLYGEIDQQMEQYWASTPQDSPSDPQFNEQINSTHGRNEHRRCWVNHDLSRTPAAESWGAKTVAAIQLDRQANQRGSSLIWHVENSLHWVLDVAFCEDQSRIRAGYAAENFATARQIALNLLKRDTTVKLGIKNKRKGCGWSETYLGHVLGLIE
jgi:predicted transposase YbfD/YdcC